MKLTRRSTAAMLLCLDASACGLLVACGSSPATRYYALQAIAPAPGSAAAQGSGNAGAGTAPALRVEPISLPPELDRLEIVTRNGPYSVRINDLDRWAAPLDEQVRRILSDDLAARLPAAAVADPNEPASNQPRRLLSVSFAQFDVEQNCVARLHADWTLHGPKGEARSGNEQLRSESPGDCSLAQNPVPAAMSVALALLADRLANDVLAPQAAAAP